MGHHTPPTRGHILGMVILAILAISTAAPLIVQTNMPGAVIAFWRMAISGTITLAYALTFERHALAALTRRDLLYLAMTGAFLAAHFYLWIASLSMTSVISSTVLVTTNPIWVALGAWIFLRERSSRSTWIAIGLGVLGALLLGWADYQSGKAGGGRTDTVSGNLLALAGALAGSASLVSGRSLRARIPFATFVSVVALTGAPLLLAAALFQGDALLPPTRAQGMSLLAIALIPHLIGNTALSWALGWLPAPRVALVILGEPVGATLLAWAFLPDQAPAPLVLAGAALILAAVVQAARQPIVPSKI